MPSYKLKYFNARGFAEVSRLLFALAGHDYEDVRFTRETWLDEKPKTTFGQMPILEIDGKQYGQSGAIYRYLARTFKLYGKNDIEALEIDQVLGICQDIINVIIALYYEKDEEKKTELKRVAREEKIPPFMTMFDKIMQNNGSTGYFVGNKISLADVVVFDLMEKVTSAVGDPFAGHPLVKKSFDNVGSDPKIKAWIQKRPKTDN